MRPSVAVAAIWLCLCGVACANGAPDEPADAGSDAMDIFALTEACPCDNYWTGTGTSGVDPALSMKSLTDDELTTICNWFVAHLRVPNACTSLFDRTVPGCINWLKTNILNAGCSVADYETCAPLQYQRFCPTGLAYSARSGGWVGATYTPSWYHDAGQWDPTFSDACVAVLICRN
jgi:hypothetical protein